MALSPAGPMAHWDWPIRQFCHLRGLSEGPFGSSDFVALNDFVFLHRLKAGQRQICNFAARLKLRWMSACQSYRALCVTVQWRALTTHNPLPKKVLYKGDRNSILLVFALFVLDSLLILCTPLLSPSSPLAPPHSSSTPPLPSLPLPLSPSLSLHKHFQ